MTYQTHQHPSQDADPDDFTVGQLSAEHIGRKVTIFGLSFDIAGKITAIHADAAGFVGPDLEVAVTLEGCDPIVMHPGVPCLIEDVEP